LAVLFLVASTVVFGITAVPAFAIRGHVFIRSLGEPCGASEVPCGPGKLNDPQGVAVDEASVNGSTGDVYVVDAGDNRVEYFTAGGANAGEFNGSGTNVLVEKEAAPTGQFSSPEGIAIDNDPGSPSFGDVYVADAGHQVIDKFSATGEYLGQLKEAAEGAGFGEIKGVAVDPTGNLWVCQQEKEIDSFSSAIANEFQSDLTSTGLEFGEVNCNGLAFAVDAGDDLYTRSFFTGTGKLNSAGEVLVREFDSLLKQPDSNEVPGAVAVDPTSAGNEVYVDNADGEGAVGRFSSTGALIEKFGSEHPTSAGGIAVDAKTSEIFVSDAAAKEVDLFALEPEGRPKIEDNSVSEIASSSADLAAQIKPAGPDTSYYFQYGTASCEADPSACVDLPASPGLDLGSGFEVSTVGVSLQGLAAGATYHFRVIAVNHFGVSEGTEQSFKTEGAITGFTLPDGRQWEMVSPPEKHGAGLIAVGNEQGADIQAAESGNSITYGTTTPITGAPAGNRAPEVAQGISTRGAPGSWSTVDAVTRHTEGATELAVGHGAEYQLFSPDLSVGLVEPEGDTPLTPKLSPEETQEKTVYLRLASGEYEPLVTHANVPAGTKFGGDGESTGGVEFVAASANLSHVVLDSNLRLTATPVEEGGGGSYLYEWTGGQLQLASVLPNGEPTHAALGDSGFARAGNVRHAISNDGTRLVFESEGHLYLRGMSGQEKTIRIDAAQGVPEPEGSVISHYRTASSEGTRTFFTSSARLTADSTASPESNPPEEDLYVFEVTSGRGEPLTGKLTDLTVDQAASESADVRGVIGASEDGTYAYFVANGVLGDGPEHGARHGTCERTHEKFHETCNLYAARYDQETKAWMRPTFITTLSGADAPSWGDGPGATDLSQMTARVSPNGHFLAFMSERSLTGYDNHDATSGVPDEEVFLYEASSERLACASCDPTGARPEGLLEGTAYEERLVDYAKNWSGRWIAANIPGWTTANLSNAQYQSRYLSNSGRVFFNSSDALVPGDVNGKEDVYEYESAGTGSCQSPGYGQSSSIVFDEASGGCVGLISAGTSSEESAFMDASESGEDAFFLTASRLSPQDVDTSLDLYDAHECAASSPCAPTLTLAPPPCATGDSCKPAPTPQPPIFGAPASATFSGAGNVVASAPRATPKSATQLRAERLARALRACARKPRRKRAACRRQARKHYAVKRSQGRKRPLGRARRAGSGAGHND
jgi:hypothetical protein